MLVGCTMPYRANDTAAGRAAAMPNRMSAAAMVATDGPDTLRAVTYLAQQTAMRAPPLMPCGRASGRAAQSTAANSRVRHVGFHMTRSAAAAAENRHAR